MQTNPLTYNAGCQEWNPELFDMATLHLKSYSACILGRSVRPQSSFKPILPPSVVTPMAYFLVLSRRRRPWFTPCCYFKLWLSLAIYRCVCGLCVCVCLCGHKKCFPSQYSTVGGWRRDLELHRRHVPSFQDLRGTQATAGDRKRWMTCRQRHAMKPRSCFVLCYFILYSSIVCHSIAMQPLAQQFPSGLIVISSYLLSYLWYRPINNKYLL